MSRSKTILPCFWLATVAALFALRSPTTWAEASDERCSISPLDDDAAWTLVSRGYQPVLSAGWSACLRTFAQEAKQDRVFEECVFWVITRTIHCFY